MKENLERQLERLSNWGINNGYEIVKSVKEVARGMNDNRKQLNKILDMNEYDYLIVEHKDRLTRFGFNYLEKLLKKDNREILVINKTEDKSKDIINDLISIVYSFSARLYGTRKGKDLSNQIKESINA